MAGKKETNKGKKTTKKEEMDTIEAAPAGGEQGQQAAAKQVAINAQYIKDLSFESPKSPASLTAMKERPQIGFNVDLKAGKLQDNIYEVVLHLTADAKQDNDAIFVVELSYGGVFTLIGIEDKELDAALMVYCPNLLFPFARRVIADVTRDGGFPPLMVEPIDFARLFAQQQAQNAGDKKAS